MRAQATIAVTAGDPCGIGPEVVLKALAEMPSARACLSGRQARFVVIGDRAVFEQTAGRLRVRLPRWELVDVGHRQTFVPGRPSRAAAAASLAYLDAAMALWRANRIQGLVTAPVTKWAIARVEPGFVGQTEYLARSMDRRQVLMMFVSDRLRVALLTRHVPLRRVPRAITPRLVEAAVRLTAEALQRQFQIPHPRLVLCGLNPHAGEGSPMSEERRIMQPVLRKLRRAGIACDGPVAADGLFANMDPSTPPPRRGRSGLRDYDVVVCGYHDQGLIPFKMAARDRGCQLSVGLPLVRTSPDHGSALDIAGQGRANPGSMRYALRLAVKLATN